MSRDDVLTKVYAQIADDVRFGDFTAIEQLLNAVSLDSLIDFLSEDEGKACRENSNGVDA